MRNITDEGRRKMAEAAKRNAETTKNKFRDLYYQNPKLCVLCGEIIPYQLKGMNKRRFCSNSCSAKYSNPQRYVKRHCIVCGKEDISKGNGKYCSRECMVVAWDKKRSEEINSGKNVSSSVMRVYLLKNFNGCFTCGNSDWMGRPITLELHHVDGDSNNNSLENVQLLCPNCHSQTDTYKGKNKGSGRHFRKERYKNGLSY